MTGATALLRRSSPLALGALLVAANLWLGASVLAPVSYADRPTEYIFVSASYQRLFVDWALAGGLLAAAAWPLLRRDDSAPGALRVPMLAWLLVPLASLTTLVAPAVGRWPALLYILYELRWCWLAFVLAVWFWRVRRGPAARRGQAGGARRRLLAPIAVAMIPASVAAISTPHLRFSGVLHGDEPKYLRYCENFYQGLGFSVAATRRLNDVRTPGPQVLNNWRLFAHAVVEEAHAAGDDLRRLVGATAPPRLVSGEPGPDMFFRGKRPGTIYQLHNPGLSFVLFPSYYVDRRWTGRGLGYQQEFPASLPALDLMLLALYAGDGLAVLILLRGLGHGRATACGLALLTALVLPVAAFAFQIYPEIAAGIAISLLLLHLVRQAPSSSIRDLAAGLLAGFLPWLHVRLGLVAVVMLVWRGADRHQAWRVRLSFLAGSLVSLGALSLYSYRLTGHLSPLATYGAEAPLSLARVVHGLPGMLFDRTYGLLSHAPVYLLALPGLTLLWRRRRDVAVLVALLAAAIALPAAGHGFWAGGATPARYLVCAMPLAAVLLGETLAAWHSRRPLLAALVALTLISLETAVRYDLSHRKEIGPLVTPGFSGWRPNLLFPSMGLGWPISAPDAGLLAAWLTVTVLLVLLPVFVETRRRERPVAARGPTLRVRDAFAALAAVAFLGTAVSAATGRRVSPDYVVSAHDVLGRAFREFASLPGCALCYSSRLGAVAPTLALGNDPGVVLLVATPPAPVQGRPVRIRARPRSTIGEFMVGDLLLEFGDGTSVQARRQFGDLEVAHTYEAPGAYRVHAIFRSSEGRAATADLDLRVGAPATPGGAADVRAPSGRSPPAGRSPRDDHPPGTP